MTIRERADGFFAQLSSKLEGEAVALNSEGAANFTLADIPFVAALDDESGTLLVCALLGTVPEGATRSRALRLLAGANCNWGGTGGGVIGLDEESDLVWLQRRFDLDIVPADDFTALVAEQLYLGRYWIARLQELEETPATLPTPDLFA
ncbi:type III secretion system chaperone [Desulfovibrio sp. OttesenSCG-928-F20]|nr:type III secretion system chaperone [Desulfovibrio sp. OttesenSCG-928-F20]